ncbi:MAG: CHAT domain-containing protein [Myxococcales bacterium]|nr:CHAT domain-containing protein [Myxococcales bacterium]
MHFHTYVLIAATVGLSALSAPGSGWSAEPSKHGAKAKPATTDRPVESAKPVDPADLAQAATAIQQASALLPQGQYAQAKGLAEKAIALIEKALGKDAVQVAEPLSILGDCLRMTGDIERGEQLQRQALTLYERHQATDNAWYAAVLYRLADVLRMRGKNVEALAIQQRLGELSVKLHGPNNPGLAVCLSAQAELQRLTGHLDKAMPLHDKAIAMAQATYGPRHAYTGSLLQARASTFEALGQYHKAESEFSEALAILEQNLGQDHTWVAQVAQNLALEKVNLGKYAQADALYARALRINEATLGPQHPFVAAVLVNQAQLALIRNHYGMAEKLLRRALDVQVTAYGEENADVANTAEFFAVLLQRTGQLADAYKVLRQALAIRERTQGKDHPHLANPLIALADVAMDDGQVEQAEDHAHRALDLLHRAHGLESAQTLPAASVLARIDQVTGDKLAWRARLHTAVVIQEAALGPNHPKVATAKGNYAASLLPEHATQAAALYREALAIDEPIFGADSLRVATNLGNLGTALAEADLPNQALPLLERALALDQVLRGKDHPVVLVDLYNIACVKLQLGEYAAAEKGLRAVLALQAKLTDGGSAAVSTRLRLAQLLEHQKNYPAALELRRQAQDTADKSMTDLLWTGDEYRKINVFMHLRSEADAVVAHAVRMQPTDAVAATLALRTVLRRHGRIVDVLAETTSHLRRRLQPDDRAALDVLAQSRTQLATLSLRGAGDGDLQAWQQAVDKLKTEVAGHEQGVSRRSGAFRERLAQPEVAAVQALLPADAALIELIVYQPQLPPATQGWHERLEPPRYAAGVLPAKGPPVWRDLGPTAVVDALVVAARRALNNPDSDPRAALTAVAQAVWWPLMPAIGSATDLRVAPDGALLLLPFAALPDQNGKYVVQTATLTYLTSGRDLLRQTAQVLAREPPLVVANPAFDWGNQAKVAPPVVKPGDLRGLQVQALPATAGEAEALAQLFPEAKVLTQGQATEGALRNAKGPRFLHIATHGFFQAAARVAGAAQSSPLLRSGLLLAGFNAHPQHGDDGALTALEAASLDLHGTQLAVLSACNTGVGDLRAGDGVQGLRRALAIAGAQTVVMSLWPVDDEATRGLMTALYGAWKAGSGRAAALRQAQLQLLGQAPTTHPFFWAAFLAAGAAK